MNLSIQIYSDALVKDFSNISDERKKLLQKLAQYIISKTQENGPVNLVYICTHNSRRSIFGQIWAKVAAEYYRIHQVNTFSGGTEATSFNSNAINALKRVGFKIKSGTLTENTHYRVYYQDQSEPIECFSKVFNDTKNPKNNFAAIMTCSNAEENCPFIPGAQIRIGTTYDDPKTFDNTALQDLIYDERCRQIALETFYVFSLIKN